MSENAWSYWSRGFELMLEEARRGIDGQRAALDSIRERASWVLTAAGATAVLFVSLTDHHGLASAVGFAVLLAVTVLCVEILRPRRVSWDMDPNIIREYMDDDVVTEAEQMVDRVALSHWECYVDNEQKLEKLNRVYVWACVGFIVEAAMLALDVMVH